MHRKRVKEGVMMLCFMKKKDKSLIDVLKLLISTTVLSSLQLLPFSLQLYLTHFSLASLAF